MERSECMRMKQHIASLEGVSRINEAIDYLYECWQCKKDDIDLCLLFVGVCFWTMEDYFELASCEREHKAHDIARTIEWNYEERMWEATEYGLAHFADDFGFCLRMGFMLAMGEYWFVCDTLSMEKAMEWTDVLLKNAASQRPDSVMANILNECDAIDIWTSLDEQQRKGLLEELETIASGRNSEDIHLRHYFLPKCLYSDDGITW